MAAVFLLLGAVGLALGAGLYDPRAAAMVISAELLAAGIDLGRNP